MPAAALALVPALAGAGAAAAGITSVWAGLAIQAGAMLFVAAVNKKRSGGTGETTSGAELQLSGDALDVRYMCYGEAWTAGTLRYRNTAGTDNRDLYLLIVLAGHEIDSVIEVEADRKILTIDGSGNVTAPAEFVGLMNIRFHNGIDAQGADGVLDGVFANWTSDHKLGGLAYAVVKITFDETNMNTVPQFRFKVRGRKVYDPRLDSTNGGSGAHRLANPATWQWSRNPVLCANDFLRGIAINGYYVAGLGLAPSRFDWANVIAEANVCDETVLLYDAVTTQARYTCDGFLDPRQTPDEILGHFELAIAGEIIPSDGKWRFFCGAYRTPTLALGPQHFIGPLRHIVHEGELDLVDTANGKYSSHAESGSPVNYSPVSLLSAVPGVARPTQFDFQLVADTTDTDGTYDGGARAQRIATLLLEKQAAGKQITCTTNLYGLRAVPGETITVSHAAFGLSAQTMRVMEVQLRVMAGDTAGLAVELVLEAGPSSLYAWTADELPLGAGPPLTQQVVSPAESAVLVFDVATTNGLVFVQSPDGGAWTPTSTTTDITFTVSRSGSTVATHTVRATRSGASLTAATFGTPTGEATTLSTTGSGTNTLTVRVTHDASNAGYTVVVLAVQGGSEGSDGEDGLDSWTPVLSANMVRNGRSFTKTVATGDWDAGFYGNERYGACIAQFQPAQSNQHFMIGLSSDPATDHDYTSIDYAIYCTNSGTLQLYEDGTLVAEPGAYVANDALEVNYDGQHIRYVKNGVVLRTAANAGDRFAIDSSFFGLATAHNVIFTATTAGKIDLSTQVSNTLTTAFADAGLINANVIINADGTLTNAGGGQAALNALPGQISAGQVVANTLTAGQIAALTITGAEIAAQTITASKMAVGTITSNELASSLIWTNDLQLSDTGKIRMGKSGPSDTTLGVWLGDDGFAGCDFHIGDASTYLWFDYSLALLTVRGNVHIDQPETPFTVSWDTGWQSGLEPTGTLYYLVSGNIVQVRCDAACYGTSNDGNFLFSGWPSVICPVAATGARCIVSVYNANTQQPGTLSISTAGNCQVVPYTGNVVGFNSAGNKGFPPGTVFFYSRV